MAPMECTICASRWFSARYHGRIEARQERCEKCGGPLVRVTRSPWCAAPRPWPRRRRLSSTGSCRATRRSLRRVTLPPGPPGSKPAQTARLLRNQHAYFDECHREYGDVFTLNLLVLPPLVVVSDPALVKRVFTGSPKALHAGEGNIILEPIVGRHSVLLVDEDRHLRQRKLLLPSFHGERMRAYGELMADETRREIDQWSVGEPFELLPSTQAITLRIILRAVFGVEKGAMARLEDALRRLLAVGDSVTAIPYLRRYRGPGGPMRRFLALRAEVDSIVYEEIASRRRCDDLEERSDVLSLLLQARDEEGRPMSDEELRDELITLLLAGHETTATTLAWIWERVLRHPGVYDRLRDNPDDEEYVEAVIEEAMRLRPVLHFAMRQVKEPFELGEWTIPPETRIGTSIYLANIREESYPHAREFRPERFVGAQPETYSWISFGGGIRRCLGASFAMYEMKVVLRTMLEQVELRAPDLRDERPKRRAITFIPSRGAQVEVVRRAPAATQSAPATSSASSASAGVPA